MDLDRRVEQICVMKEERTEWFRKWATFVVSTVALLVACLREPMALTLKATVLEIMREELTRYDTVSAADFRAQKQQDSVTEALKRFERELTGLRDLTVAGASHDRMFLEVSNRLSSLETKIEALRREK
ncbi:MAG TPA: hypothetical protein VFT34_12395 [Verrucomicrobiae bacterium]|nr:hypothetical protein [Verrucomicrobiae bacterium]